MSATQSSLGGPSSVINSFPPEILGHIFLLAQGSLDDSSLDWIAVAQVSGYWRSVALNYHSLWSTIKENYHKTLVEKCIERSLKLPLSVIRSVAEPRGLPPLRKILKEMPRIRFLRLKIRLAFWTQIQHLFSMEAPTLEELYIERSVTSRFRGDLVLPKLMFPHGAPALERLTIIRCNFSLDSRLFHGLTHLSLKFLTSRLEWTSVLQALRSMPRLRSCTMHNSLNWENTATGNSIANDLSPLTLNHLEEIDISEPAGLLQGNYGPSLNLLSNLRFPATATTTIYLIIFDSNILPAFQNVLEVYQNAVISPCRPIRGISLETTPQGHIKTKLCHRLEGDLLQFTLCCGSLNTPLDLSPLVETLYTLPLSEVSLFRTNVVLPGAMWTSLFFHLEHLHDLIIFEDGADAFLDYLNERFDPSPPPSTYAGSDDESESGEGNIGEDDNDTGNQIGLYHGENKSTGPAIPLSLSSLELDTIHPANHALDGLLQGLYQKRQMGAPLSKLKLGFYGPNDLAIVKPFMKSQPCNKWAYSFSAGQ